ncbi:MAG: hypothetical protein P1U56_20360 [Saprospiraceae bacterium]|nr:hypothetical protein [Saprospiraceae bacterium]
MRYRDRKSITIKYNKIGVLQYEIDKINLEDRNINFSNHPFCLDTILKGCLRRDIKGEAEGSSSCKLNRNRVLFLKEHKKLYADLKQIKPGDSGVS